jgi:hypothetical protein
LWIREICRTANKTIVLEKNDFESTKTEVSLDMAEKGVVKGSRSQIAEMMLESGEEGAGAEHVRHHRKTSRKFTQLPWFSEWRREFNSSRKANARQMKDF